MSQFQETVTKLAASPAKRALLPVLPFLLQKEGGLMDYLFGAGKDITGGQEIARKVVGGLGQAAAIGGGSYLVGKGLDRIGGSNERLSAERSQIGKLTGEQNYRQGILQKLHPLHKQVFTEIQADPIIAKADPQLINSSYDTMKRFAPHLATDPNAVRSFLRENAMFGTGPSYATLKNLADAEQAVGKAGGLGV